MKPANFLPKKIKGWYTWLHHDIPVEYTFDLQERLTYIKYCKPVHEQAIRLAAIKKVPLKSIPPQIRKLYYFPSDEYEFTIALAKKYSPKTKVKDGKLVF